jgi:hypothetical protein
MHDVAHMNSLYLDELVRHRRQPGTAGQGPNVEPPQLPGYISRSIFTAWVEHL